MDSVLRLRRARAVDVRGRRVLRETDVMLLGGLEMGFRGRRFLAQAGGRPLAFLLRLVLLLLLLLRVGVEQRGQAERHDGWRVALVAHGMQRTVVTIEMIAHSAQSN